MPPDDVRSRTADALAEIGRLLSQALDPELVGPRVVTTVAKLLGVRAAALYRVDEGEAPVFTAGTVEETAMPGARAAAARAAGERLTIHAGSLVALPLSGQGRVLAALVVVREGDRAFDADDVRLAEVFAELATLALENARLYAETERRRREAEALAASARTLTGQLDVDAVAERVVQSVRTIFGAQLTVLRLLRPDAMLALTAWEGPPDIAPTPDPLLPSGAGVMGRVVLEGRPISSPDVRRDTSGRIDDRTRTRLTAAGLPAVLAVPLRAKGRVLGALMIADKEARVFAETEIRLLETFADQAALALDNARLFEAERQAREALAASETRYRELFENVSDVIYVHDMRGLIVEGNRAGAQMLGYSLEEIIGMNIAELVADHDIGRAVDLVSRTARGEHVETMETFELVRKDGTRAFIEVHTRRIDKDGVPVAVQGVGRDVTARRRLEIENTALQQDTERRRREAEALAHIGKAITESLDAPAVAQRIVDSVLPLFAAEGSNVRMLDADGGLTALSFAGVSQRLDRFAAGMGVSGWAVRAGHAVHTPDLLVEPVISYPDHLRPRLASSPYRAALAVPLRVKGTTLGALTVIGITGRRFDDREIRLLDAFADQAALALENARLHAETEQRRREAEELARVAKVLTETLEASAVAERIVGAVLPLFGAQAAVLRVIEPGGLRAIASVGPGHAQLPPGHVAPANTGVIGQAAATGRATWSRDITADPSLNFTDEMRRSLAAWGTRAVLAVPLRAGGATIGVLSFGLTAARDFPPTEVALLEAFADQAVLALENARLYSSVKSYSVELETKVRERTQQLLQSEKLATMGSLLAGVAHELNNPLSVVTGQTLLLRRATTDSGLRDRADKISRAAERCARIVRNFLALARQRPPERGRVIINNVVNEAVELLGYPLRVDNVRVTLDLGDDLPELWADPNQLHQVLVNLMTNAHQAMREVPEPRRITITTRHEPVGGRVHLSVADNGPGIPPEIETRIFDAFFTTKAPGQGTGLGLSLCQGIVTSHNGTIGLRSHAGAGTVFTVELPIELPAEAAAPPASTAVAQSPVGRRILVIDDEPEILEILAEMLGTGGVEVDTAEDGVRALEQLGKHHYDLVVTDVRMPGLDGPALYRAAAQRDPAAPAKFIFITGDTLRPETHEFLEATGAPVVHKPFEAGEVERVVAQALSRASS